MEGRGRAGRAGERRRRREERRERGGRGGRRRRVESKEGEERVDEGRSGGESLVERLRIFDVAGRASKLMAVISSANRDEEEARGSARVRDLERVGEGENLRHGQREFFHERPRYRRSP